MDQNISLSRGLRILYFLVTILLPVVSFLLVNMFPGIVSPEWQSGKISEYGLILLGGEVSIYFYPFLVYAMIGMLLLLWSPERYSKKFINRFGIYTGTLFALQYSIIMLLAVAKYDGYVFIAGGLLVPGITKWMYSIAEKKLGNRNTINILVGLFLIVLLLSVVYVLDWSLILLPVVFSILASGPFWCLIISTRISIKLLKIYGLSKQETRIFGISIVAWLVPFLVSWRLAFLKMLKIYSSLPTSPPHCYISTAVAKGHPRFVKSKPVIYKNGCVLWVNSQLRTFKCAEIFLSAVWPKAHRIVRTMYDVLGPRLSRLIIHPIQADAIFLIFKPFEWLTKEIIRVIIPDFEQLSETIYQSSRVSAQYT